MADDRVLTFEDLKLTKRWPYSREHTYVLVKAGKFPKPFKVNRLNLWMESVIDNYLANRQKSAGAGDE